MSYVACVKYMPHDLLLDYVIFNKENGTYQLFIDSQLVSPQQKKMVQGHFFICVMAWWYGLVNTSIFFMADI